MKTPNNKTITVIKNAVKRWCTTRSTSTTDVSSPTLQAASVAIPNSASYVSLTSTQYSLRGRASSVKLNPAVGVVQRGSANSDNILTIFGNNNVEIVRISNDGAVIWKNTPDHNAISEAAEAFSQVLSFSVEKRLNIMGAIKSKMRDTVFKEIIDIAKINGVLTADELTFMYESSKIMEKLKWFDGV